MVHRAAAAGFGEEAERYQSARPTYHPLLVDRFVQAFGDGRVIEIGAGTGIFTRQLTEAGVDLVAVEPVAAMAAVLAREQPQVVVEQGAAEDLPVEDRSVDTVVAAQAFHWFDHPRALDEIARVLRPGGHLVTVWNVKEGDGEWYRRYMAIIDRYADDAPRHRDMVWRRAIEADDRFEPVDDWQVDNSQEVDREAVIGRFLSTSFIAALPDAEKATVASELRAELDDALTGSEGPIRFPYRGELQAWVMG